MTGTGPMGCVPAELAMRSRNGNCDPELTRAAELFNPQLVQMLGGLNRQIGADVFIAANTQLSNSDFIRNPSAFGKAQPCLWAKSYVVNKPNLFFRISKLLDWLTCDIIRKT